MDIKDLDNIVKNTLRVIEQGKSQIYDIAEYSHQEYQRLLAEVSSLKTQAANIIAEVDKLEGVEKTARLRLAEVSRNFGSFTEDDIKMAYQDAQELQINLVLLREQEKQIRLRRNQLEISLNRLEKTAKKAENLMTLVGAAFQYLQENVDGLSPALEEIQQKQQLGIRIIKAQEEERRRVAREIHDGPAQLLANIVLRVEICQKLIEIDDMLKVRQELNGIKESVKMSLQDVRKIIFDLRPMTLDDLGLLPAIKKHIENMEDRFYGDISFQYLGQEQRYNPTVELSIFRIFQEGLNNAIKHGDAREIDIKLELKEDKVALRIRDNGKGFNLEEVLNNKDRGSFGLISMKERVELLNGEIKISSKIGKGTEIFVRIFIKR